MDEVLSAFLAECHENLEKLDNELVQLERDPFGPQVQSSLANIFRTVHTIKGSCGWLGLVKLEAVVHDGEDLLVCLREGKLKISTEIVNALLEMFDAIREILAQIAETEKEGNTDYSALIEKLKRLQTAEAPVDTAAAEQATLQAVPSAEEPLLEALPLTSTETSVSAVEPLGPETLQQAPRQALGPVTTNIRVDIRLLDQLMNLVGELVLSRNQMVQYSHSLQDSAFLSTCQRLNLITSELQESVMKTRMQPIETIWKAFPRMIRDLALDCGKQVQLEMEGQNTELDRSLLEAIKDPLTHILRNAADHGLELPAERQQAQKPTVGHLRLKAFHEGGYVNISISDDGRGLDARKIRQKALDKGLITPAQAAQMSEQTLFQLIFQPGFSTAEQVTHISGRGVGLDVVKNNIESIGGKIEMSSELGKGSRFQLKIPLTLAIIPALMVTAEQERFAIPQINLVELVCLEGERAVHGIETVYNTLVYRLRGQLLPLIYLSQELGLSWERPDYRQLTAEQQAELLVNIVVLQADGQQFGLVVDQIHDTEEIVVKPLSKHLKALGVYAGATILGDGQVALILDVMGIAQRIRVLGDTQAFNEQLLDTQQSQFQRLLLFRAAGQRLMAMPLAHVVRLEDIAPQLLEFSGDTPVIQYRNQILPLVDLSAALAYEGRNGSSRPFAATDEELLRMIVCQYQQQWVGLVVEQILDIVEVPVDQDIQTSLKREGILGSLILEGVVTEIIDFSAILQRKLPGLGQTLMGKTLVQLG